MERCPDHQNLIIDVAVIKEVVQRIEERQKTQNGMASEVAVLKDRSARTGGIAGGIAAAILMAGKWLIGGN